MTVTLPRLLWLIVSAASYFILAYTVPRQQFGLLIGLLSGLFLGYAWAIRQNREDKEQARVDRFFFASALLFRLILLLAIPKLSDDFYRFIWDGRLLAHGFNPYLYVPSKLLGTSIADIAGLDERLFHHLNSPSYFTVYPALNQALFGLAAWLSPNNMFGTIVGLRVFILLSEIGTLWLMPKLLRQLNLNPNLALFYGLNPLVILELTGNLHFEGVMIFFGLLAVWWLTQGRWVASAWALALAIGTKLLPLILLPLIVRRLGWGRGLAYAALTAGLAIALFLPFASLDLIWNVFSSINLYFQKFEFNASAYYLIRAVGYRIKEYNIIGYAGLCFPLITTFSIVWIAFRWRGPSSGAQVLAILTIYFAFATTVHPWYITSLVAASVYTRFRYPLIWSALIPLSYFAYRTWPYHENLWLTAIQYS